MIVLDSNVLSALMRDPPDEQVKLWLDRQPTASLWTTSINLLEVHFGIELLEQGKQRRRLSQILTVVLQRLEDRVIPLDSDAARCAAELMARRQKQGRPRGIRDSMIAGAVISHKATLATRNIAHFDDAGIPLINPWTA